MALAPPVAQAVRGLASAVAAAAAATASSARSVPRRLLEILKFLARDTCSYRYIVYILLMPFPATSAIPAARRLDSLFGFSLR